MNFILNHFGLLENINKEKNIIFLRKSWVRNDWSQSYWPSSVILWIQKSIVLWTFDRFSRIGSEGAFGIEVFKKREVCELVCHISAANRDYFEPAAQLKYATCQNCGSHVGRNPHLFIKLYKSDLLDAFLLNDFQGLDDLSLQRLLDWALALPRLYQDKHDLAESDVGNVDIY